MLENDTKKKGAAHHACAQNCTLAPKCYSEILRTSPCFLTKNASAELLANEKTRKRTMFCGILVDLQAHPKIATRTKSARFAAFLCIKKERWVRSPCRFRRENTYCFGGFPFSHVFYDVLLGSFYRICFAVFLARVGRPGKPVEPPKKNRLGT